MTCVALPNAQQLEAGVDLQFSIGRFGGFTVLGFRGDGYFRQVGDFQDFLAEGDLAPLAGQGQDGGGARILDTPLPDGAGGWHAGGATDFPEGDSLGQAIGNLPHDGGAIGELEDSRPPALTGKQGFGDGGLHGGVGAAPEVDALGGGPASGAANFHEGLAMPQAPANRPDPDLA